MFGGYSYTKFSPFGGFGLYQRSYPSSTCSRSSYAGVSCCTHPCRSRDSARLLCQWHASLPKRVFISRTPAVAAISIKNMSTESPPCNSERAKTKNKEGGDRNSGLWIGKHRRRKVEVARPKQRGNETESTKWEEKMPHEGANPEVFDHK